MGRLAEMQRKLLEVSEAVYEPFNLTKIDRTSANDGS